MSAGLLDFSSVLNELRDRFFNKIHSSNLVYNTCWEDPRLDRKILEIGQDDQIVMITSAGCNALDYLLDNPKSIHCIDVNPRQNALLELKMAGIRHLSFEDFFKLFGEGYHPKAQEIYHQSLKPSLPDYAQVFWDEKIRFFTSPNRSFYFRGTSGKFAWLFKLYFDSDKTARQLTYKLLECQTLEEQRQAYLELEPKLFNKMVKWLMNRHVTMSMLGVPRAQRQLILDGYPGGMSGYLSDNLRHILCDLPIQENYFWHLYIKGCYTRQNCPNYLREEHFDTLKGRVNNITCVNKTITQFLQEQPGAYSIFILLDHQDWLAHYNAEALEEEWMEIIKNSRPQSQALMRSAALEIEFLPQRAKEAFSWENLKETHQQDRVGTYGCTYRGRLA